MKKGFFPIWSMVEAKRDITYFIPVTITHLELTMATLAETFEETIYFDKMRKVFGHEEENECVN